MAVIITKKILFALVIAIPVTILVPVHLTSKQTIPCSQIVKAEAIVNKPNESPLTIEIKSNVDIQVINIICTYYTNSIHDCGKTDAISASGENLNILSQNSKITYVAAPSDIGYGTQLSVLGVGICQVEDRGSAIKYVWIDGVRYMKLDVYVKGASRKELLQKGELKTKGYILQEKQDFNSPV